MLRVLGSLTSLALCASAVFSQTPETEPNNTPATANNAVLGGRVRGTLRIIDFSYTGDDDPVDWWVVHASAGQTIFADVDADEYGSYLDSWVGLYASDGTTQLARSGNWDGFDPYIAYRAPTTGTYYIAIGTGIGEANNGSYTINFSEAKCPVSAEEGEPNDAPGQAKTIALGQSVHGNSCPYSDDGGGVTNADYFKIQVPAGTKFELQVDTVGRERPRFGCACEITAWMRLLASDGSTTLAETSEYDYPKRLEYTASTGGTYYISVLVWPGGIRYPYTLRVRSLSSGRGDPPIARADGLGSPWGVVADPTGDFIVSDESGNQVWWVTSDGRKQVIAHAIQAPSALGWDVFSNLLIVGRAGVYKLTPQGNVSQMIGGENFRGVALGADGTLWFTVSNSSVHELRHFDPVGNLLETISLNLASGELGPYEIAVSSSGDVYYATDNANTPGGSTIYRLVSKQGQRVFQTAVNIVGLAIDATGNFYITSSTDNQVYRYSSTGTAMDAPFASQLNAPIGIAFGRNTDGSMTSRLFAVEHGGRFLELNPAGVDQRGAPVGFATPSQAIADLLKAGPLTDAQRQVLDQVGNKNGRYDVGDLRAFLIRTTTLPASSAAPIAEVKP